MVSRRAESSTRKATNLTARWRASFSQRLLRWYDREARDLPWRRTNDLYAIWISEIMLQQTQVATVIPYWQRFISRFPDVATLAAAEESEVMRLWEGLGYYRRARQLHAAAQRIALEHDSRFPTHEKAVRSLPGIGRYTAGAILSIGLDQRLPILEANSIRVLSRVTGYQGEVTSTAGQRFLWSAAEQLLPGRRCGAFNQALMELGSEICTPRSPTCGQCPIAKICQSRLRNLTLKIPRLAKKTKYEDVTEIALVIRRQNEVILRRCQPGERWAGLWDFPRFAMDNGSGKKNGSLERHVAGQARAITGLEISNAKHFITIKHGVTRFRITLMGFEAELCNGRVPKQSLGTKRLRPDRNSEWVRIDALEGYPLSKTGRQISRVLMSGYSANSPSLGCSTVR